MISLFLFVFRISPKKLWCTPQKWRCSSGTNAAGPVLPKKQATICFEVIFPQTMFVGFGLFSMAVVLSRAHTHRSMICQLCRSYKRLSTSIVFFQHFYAPIDKSLFWAIRDSASCSATCSCSIECMLVGEMSKDSSISRYYTWWYCIISSRTASMFSGTTAVLGGPSQISSLNERHDDLIN